MYHSTLVWRVIRKKKKTAEDTVEFWCFRRHLLESIPNPIGYTPPVQFNTDPYRGALLIRNTPP